MATTIVQTQTLYYQEGSSDKVYQIQIEEASDGLYHVNAFYGRRGATLQQAPKTASGPVPLAKAESIYNKEIRGKQAKGYTPNESGAVYVSTSNEDRVTGLRPQLLNFIDEDRARELLDHPSWLMQEKKDGVRIMGRVEETHTEKVTLSNRKGLSVAAPTTVLREVAKFPTGTVVDGELVGDTYWLFDVLQWGETDYRDRPYTERFELLRTYEDTHTSTQPSEKRPLRTVPTAFSTVEKHGLYNELVNRSAEGVVFKKMDSIYIPGRPASGGNQLKFKFYSTVTCYVQAINNQRSIAISATAENGGMVSIGNVTIPPNYNIPPQGSYVEVRYLYAYRGGSLYQPTYQGERLDKTSADPVRSLKFKPEGTDEE